MLVSKNPDFKGLKTYQAIIKAIREEGYSKSKGMSLNTVWRMTRGLFNNLGILSYYYRSINVNVKGFGKFIPSKERVSKRIARGYSQAKKKKRYHRNYWYIREARRKAKEQT